MKLLVITSLPDDWFGSQGGDFDSIDLFSFAGDAGAAKAVVLVDGYNKKEETGFPLRAFVLPVERTSQLTENR